MTARSSVLSAPTTVAVAVLPSLNCTSRLVAPSITWLLVRISPSADRMTPEPSPDELDDEASTTAATCSTEPAAAAGALPDSDGDVSSDDDGAAVDVDVDVEVECTW